MNEDMIPPRMVHPRHYYGDTVRALFVAGAVVLVVAETTGAQLPLSDAGAITGAIILAVAAGITNPNQRWIHYVNEAIAIVGALLFTLSAVAHWRAGVPISDRSYLFAEALAILSIVSLYFTTKTIRGLLLRHRLD